MPYKRSRGIESQKIDSPKERSLQIQFSPQIDKGMENYTILMSTLVPHRGETGIHTYPVDEVIYVPTLPDEIVEKIFKNAKITGKENMIVQWI